MQAFAGNEHVARMKIAMQADLADVSGACKACIDVVEQMFHDSFICVGQFGRDELLLQ